MKMYVIRHDFYYYVDEVDIDHQSTREMAKFGHDNVGRDDARRVVNLLMTNGETS